MTKNKGGRPRKEFDWDKLDSILFFGATFLECEELMGVSEATIKRRIKEKYKCSFEHYRDKKMSKARRNLRRKQYETAMSGNITMQIWLGKQWLGQTDKSETKNTNTDIVSYEELIRSDK